MKTIRLILASTSPYRAELLSKLGLDFEAIAPNVEETAQEHETATELVQRLALEKASALKNEKDAVIIGSDQVCVIDGKIIGKPLTRSNAIHQLQQQSGKTVRFYTGLAVYNTKTQQSETVIDTLDVTFRKLTTTQIERYVDMEQPLYCAGSFKSEGLGITLFSQLDGKDPNTLVGLPLIDLVTLLAKQGISPLA
ncbi:septum formation inhibitor Maf [Vibrio mediterranei]|uniref:Maf family protein n=1 Tax=Vibrio mediterranei TaxID=689 RepID=UPI000D17F6D9|nr:Maf family protein [Vibrio mediterranei]MCG9658626.1 Maf-like protein [Vibrio mediterranei]PTC06056.1 septum formation inhibitor Maf [Vibrio mediterranei]